MKKKYKYLFLSSVVIGNLVTSPVFALTGETSTNETTVSETTPTMENLMEETTKIPTSEEITSSSTAEVPKGTNEVENSSSSTEDVENEQETTTSSTSTDTSSTETSQTENNKETRDVTTDGNWNYHISGEYAYLDSYAGSSTDIVVPNEINGKQTLINLYSGVPVSKINQDQVTSITFSNNNGKKCKLNSTYVRFNQHSSLQTFDGKGLDVSPAENMYNLFVNCSNLISVDVSNWDTSNVTNMAYMFYGCSNLTSLNVSNFNTSNVTDMRSMFYNCNNLTSLNVSNLNTANVTDMSYMFYNCSNLTSLNVSNLNTTNVTNMYGMFANCSNLTSLNVSNFNTSNVTDMSHMFYDCNNLTSLDLSNFNTANVTDMSYMFSYCRNLTSLNVSNFNTSNVTDMSCMFNDCRNLTSLNVSNFNTANVTDMTSVFNSCSKLQTLDVSNWNTSYVTDMTRTFNGCSNLTSLDISKWNTSNVTNFTSMFNDCMKLTHIDINNFNFASATNMDYMFCNCSVMSIIDLSGITFPSNISMTQVFFNPNPNPNPLLVKATDPKLLNYNYASDNRVPIGPSFNANGGHFSDNLDTKYYFEKCALEPTDPKFQLSTFNNYKNTVEKPIKDGSLFYEWQLTSGTEPTKNDDLLNSNIVYSAQWTPSLINDHIPSQDVDNVKPEQSSIFGIAYMPKEFDFGSVTLQDAGKQNISLEGGDYHVAVRDQRMMASGWSLQAQLKWTGKAIPGAEILTSHQGNEVLKNTNDGSQDFNAASDFEPCSLSEVRAEQKVVIKSDSPNVLMTAATQKHNAVYDYDLGRVTIRIPEVKYIQPGSYSGYVNWNLVNAPST